MEKVIKMYDKIKNDPYIVNVYNEISKYEDETGGWGHHNLDHVTNVADMVEHILKIFNYEEDFIEDAKVAALLHDLGCIIGKQDHPSRSYEMAKKYLSENNIVLKYEDLVFDAIKVHSDGFDTDNMMALALIISDKLDMKKTRVARAGYFVDGMKEIQYINDIFVSVKDNTFVVEFLSDSEINREALDNYYFIPKVFKSIKAFSKKMNLDYIVLFNGEVWNFDKF